MMILDACFVLELFRGYNRGFTQLGYSRYDPIFSMCATMQFISGDMILLENQIPFFVINKLFGIQEGRTEQTREVSWLALRFFESLVSIDAPLKSDWEKMEQDELHCLEVFRRSLLTVHSPDRNREVGNREYVFIHCVTKLRAAGIRLKKRETNRFWDIKFENGILEIPSLLVQDCTMSVFLNIIAYEQCHRDCTRDITSYVIFMNSLIDSLADVNYLNQCGIIKNRLGSDAKVAEMFNRLSREVVCNVNDSSLSRLSMEVDRYCENRWNTWMANLNDKYFNNPWSVVSFFAALMLLTLTTLQTFYSVYGFYGPK